MIVQTCGQATPWLSDSGIILLTQAERLWAYLWESRLLRSRKNTRTGQMCEERIQWAHSKRLSCELTPRKIRLSVPSASQQVNWQLSMNGDPSSALLACVLGSQSFVTPSLGNNMYFSGLWSYPHTCSTQIHTHIHLEMSFLSDEVSTIQSKIFSTWNSIQFFALVKDLKQTMSL